jgi:putative DNA primase/helicase
MPYAVEAISFSPTHKLVIAGNHAPVVTDDGDGMWRRMILFPFTQTFEGKDCDPDLLDKLWLESSGILNLWLEGFLEWERGGLQVPASLARATNAYRDEQDLLLDWMNEKCEVAPNLETDKLILFAAYREWCEDSSYRNLSKGSFSRKLTGRGFKVTSDKRRWLGIGLKDGVHSARLR